MYNYLLFVC